MVKFFYDNSSKMTKDFLERRTLDRQKKIAHSSQSEYKESIVTGGVLSLVEVEDSIAQQLAIYKNKTDVANGSKSILQNQLVISIPVAAKTALANAEATAESKKAEAKRKYDAEIAKVADDLQAYKERLENDKEAVINEHTAAIENAESVIASAEEDASTNLLKVQAMVKAVEIGQDVLHYIVDQYGDMNSEDDKADLQKKSNYLYNQLVNKIQPAILSGNREKILEDVINWVP